MSFGYTTSQIPLHYTFVKHILAFPGIKYTNIVTIRCMNIKKIRI